MASLMILVSVFVAGQSAKRVLQSQAVANTAGFAPASVPLLLSPPLAGMVASRVMAGAEPQLNRHGVVGLEPLWLRASPHRRPRAGQLVATEWSPKSVATQLTDEAIKDRTRQLFTNSLEVVKDRTTQLTDLRTARASHILIRGNDNATLDQLAEWKREIGNDEEIFAKFAREHSTCPSRSRGGDLGYFKRGKMVKEFDRIVFNEEPGAVYGPVRTGFGNHLIFLHSCQRDGGFPVKRLNTPGRDKERTMTSA